MLESLVDINEEKVRSGGVFSVLMWLSQNIELRLTDTRKHAVFMLKNRQNKKSIVHPLTAFIHWMLPKNPP